MSNSKASIVPGILIILLGSVLFVHEMDWFHFDWYNLYPLIFLLMGAALILISILDRNHNPMFWGTILLLLGVLFLMRNYGYLNYFSFREVWPVFLIIIGLAFVTSFLLRPNDLGMLIPAGFLIIPGSALLLRKLHFWAAYEYVANFWPLLIVLVGVVIVVKSLKK